MNGRKTSLKKYRVFFPTRIIPKETKPLIVIQTIDIMWQNDLRVVKSQNDTHRVLENTTLHHNWPQGGDVIVMVLLTLNKGVELSPIWLCWSKITTDHSKYERQTVAPKLDLKQNLSKFFFCFFLKCVCNIDSGKGFRIFLLSELASCTGGKRCAQRVFFITCWHIIVVRAQIWTSLMRKRFFHFWHFLTVS